MRISSIDPTPFYSFPYRSAVSGGGTETRACALNRGVVDVLPTNIDALVVTADLQGVVGHGRANRLLGSELAMQLVSLALDKAIPSLDHVGVVIAGHCWWPDPLATLHDDVQALNVDSRVIVLTRERTMR